VLFGFEATRVCWNLVCCVLVRYKFHHILSLTVVNNGDITKYTSENDVVSVVYLRKGQQVGAVSNLTDPCQIFYPLDDSQALAVSSNIVIYLFFVLNFIVLFESIRRFPSKSPPIGGLFGNLRSFLKKIDKNVYFPHYRVVFKRAQIYQCQRFLCNQWVKKSKRLKLCIFEKNKFDFVCFLQDIQV